MSHPVNMSNNDVPGPEKRGSSRLWLEALGVNPKKEIRDPRYLQAAQAIFVNFEDIEELAADIAEAFQDRNLFIKERCRIVALLLEEYLTPKT